MIDELSIIHALGMLAVLAAMVAVTMVLEPWRSRQEEQE